MGLLGKIASLFSPPAGDPGYDINAAQKFVYERLAPEIQAKLTIPEVSLLIAGIFDWLDNKDKLAEDHKQYDVQRYLASIVTGQAPTLMQGAELQQFKQAMGRLSDQELDEVIRAEKEFAAQNGTSRPAS